jgi:hypothetical protein
MEMQMTMKKMCNEKITIRTQDGREFRDVPAVVDLATGTIIHFDTQIPVRVGDTVLRTTPAGADTFIVEDPGFQPGHGSIEPSYVMKVRRADAAVKAPGGTVYNVTGANARFNINSTDSSVNVVNQVPSELFDTLRQALEKAVPSPDREELVRLSRELESNVGKKTFQERYVAFMQLAATHVDVVTPFLPALTQLLTRG